MRREVSRLLTLQGFAPVQTESASRGGSTVGDRIGSGKKARLVPQPICITDPPTFVRIVWPENSEIPFYPTQRRYIRVETDAPSNYFNAKDATQSKINVVLDGVVASVSGATPLEGGRMRLIIDGKADSVVDTVGRLQVLVLRPGQSFLEDSRTLRTVVKPVAHIKVSQVSMPRFEIHAVEGLDDPMWSNLDWPSEVAQIAADWIYENGTLQIYYSAAYPKVAAQVAKYEKGDIEKARSFVKRYEIWLVVYSLLGFQDEQALEDQSTSSSIAVNESAREAAKWQELCRVASMATLMAAREIAQASVTTDDD